MLSLMRWFLEGRVFVNTTSGAGRRVVERGVMYGEEVLSVLLPLPPQGKVLIISLSFQD